MARQVKALVARPDHISLIPRIHDVGGENQLLQLAL